MTKVTRGLLGSATATAPTVAEWEALPKRATNNDRIGIDVAVPVYRGHDETLRCIFSVLDSAPQNPPFRLVVINDRSPDARLAAKLKELASTGHIDLRENSENLGFVGSINVGLMAHPDRDVIILNSDTEVFGDWIARLRRTAYAQPNVASVTPFSNNAEICSYPCFVSDFPDRFEVPDAHLDQLASIVNQSTAVEIPTGVGFCMYMPRSAIDAVGGFDRENFGRGYGEENDWCRRAVRNGLVNLLACDVFVRHYGGTSFGAEKLQRIRSAMDKLNTIHPSYPGLVAEFVRSDPVRAYRRRLDSARFRNAKGAGKTCLIVSHDRGGGTERHIRELAEQLRTEGHLVIFGRPLAEDRNRISFACHQMAPTEVLGSLVVERDLSEFVQVLHDCEVDFVHVHHLIDFPHSTSDLITEACRATGIPYYATIHDYFAVCPRVTMVNAAGLYCGEPDLPVCENCISISGSEVGNPSVWEWRARYARFLGSAERVFVPNADVKARIGRYFPELEILVRPHVEAATQATSCAGTTDGATTVRRVLIIGAISAQKGSWLIEDVARYAASNSLPLHFTIMGITDRPLSIAALRNVTVTGYYEEGQAVDMAARMNAHLAWFPAVWPETYSYTLSVALAARIFPVAFDIGAIADRIRSSQYGLLLPFEAAYDPATVAESLAGIPVEVLRHRPASRLLGHAYNNLARDYYEA